VSNILQQLEDNKKEGNSYKDNYHQNVAPKQDNELEIVYYAMCQYPDQQFTSHDIPKILIGSGTNIASRIYRALQLNGLINPAGQVTGEKGVACLSYKVINPEREFKITKIATVKEKTIEDKEIDEICIAMTKLFLTRDLNTTDDNRMAMTRNFSKVLYHINKGDNVFKTEMKDFIKSQGSKATVYEKAFKVLTDLDKIFNL
jgi:hypothetical protein